MKRTSTKSHSSTVKSDYENSPVTDNFTRIVTMEAICLNEPKFDDLTVIGDGNREILALSSHALQNYLSNIEGLLTAAKHDPDLKPDRSDIALLYLRMSLLNCHLGEYEAALDSAQCAFRMEESALAYYRIGCAQYCLKRFDEALQSFMQGIKWDPASPHLKHAIEVALARCRSKKDRPDPEALLLNDSRAGSVASSAPPTPRVSLFRKDSFLQSQSSSADR